MGTRANLMSGGGTLYVAPTGTALPEMDDIDPGLIVPSGSWSATGFRTEPVEIEYDPKMEEVVVEEHLAAVKLVLTAESAMLTTGLGERDMAAYQQAISAITATSVSAGADQTAQKQFSVGDGTLGEVSLLFIGKSPAGYSRAIYIPVAVANAKIKDSYGKKFAGLPASWFVLADPTQTAGKRLIQVFDITAVPTS